MLGFAIVSVVTGFLLPLITLRRVDLPLNAKILQKIRSMPMIWALSQWFFSLLMFSTWFVDNPWASVTIVGLAGISWGATQWIPFTLLGEYIAYLQDTNSSQQDDIEPLFEDDSDTLPTHSSLAASFLNENSSSDSPRSLSAGIVLGIHNVYIVLPQFVSTLMSAAVFWMSENEDSASAFGSVLRIGGAFSIIAGIMALQVKEMKRRDC